MWQWNIQTPGFVPSTARSYRSPGPIRTVSFTSWAAAGTGLPSVAMIRRPGSWRASAIAIAPEPVPTSTTVSGRPAAKARAASTRISVSGRGTSTRASTPKVTP